MENFMRHMADKLGSSGLIRLRMNASGTWTVQTIDEVQGGEIELRPGVDIMSLWTAEEGASVGLIATDELPEEVAMSIVRFVPRQLSAFKAWRFGGDFADKLYVYSLGEKPQVLDVGSLRCVQVVFGDDFVPYATGFRGTAFTQVHVQPLNETAGEPCERGETTCDGPATTTSELIEDLGNTQEDDNCHSPVPPPAEDEDEGI